MCLYTSSAMHHFNDCTGLSPYITERGRFGDDCWQCGRASDRTGRSAELTLDDRAVVRFSAGQSPYYVSAVRVCVWFTGCTGVSSDARLSRLTSEVEGFSWLTRSVSRSLSCRHKTRHCHWVQHWSISLRAAPPPHSPPRAVVPASCGGHAVPRKKKKTFSQNTRTVQYILKGILTGEVDFWAAQIIITPQSITLQAVFRV